MKTLVAGAVAALLCSAALVTSSAAPAVADAPTVNATCKYIEVRIAGQPGSDNQFYYAVSRASLGEPTELQPFGTAFADHFYYLAALDPADSFIWRLEVHSADGTVVWSQSGTTTACWPVDLGVTTPVVPPEPPCGSTLDDVAWPVTPGIVYSHDEWFGYARLQPGWRWPSNPPYRPLSWAYMDTIKSDLAVIQAALILDPTGHCGIPAKSPPESALPGSPCWYENPNPSPCPTPVHNGPSTPGSATTKVAKPPASTPRSTAPVATAPSPAATPTTTSVLPPSPTSTPSAAATATVTPAPSPSPSATPVTQAAHRVATTTGLGLAGGVAGASVLAAAGAFVVRRRLRPTPNGVVLDESGEPEALD